MLKHVNFWVLRRNDFNKLVEAGKITNQGSETSTQGYWMSYSNVAEYLKPCPVLPVTMIFLLCWINEFIMYISINNTDIL